MGIEVLGLLNFVDMASIRICTDFIGVYKQFLRYPSDREYVISIVIAIPDNTQAPYGMPLGKRGTIGFFHAGESKYSHLLDTEYDKYDNLDQYILASVIKAIDLGLTKGFTCYGKKIKFQGL